MIDKHDFLKTEPFSYRVGKDGLVTLFWEGRPVRTVKGPAAEKFLAAVQGADPFAAQLAMAKITGNFKRGNERR